MKVVIEKHRCVGHARCFTISPEVYTLDDDGYIATSEVVVPEGLEKAALRGARACPERIISVAEDGSSPADAGSA